MGGRARTVHGGGKRRKPAQSSRADAVLAKGTTLGVRAVVYDAAVLIAADRNDRKTWVDHISRFEMGVVQFVLAPVVAQVSRSPQQAQLRRFLAGCRIVSLEESGAHQAGRLLGRSRTADVVDAVVVATAIRHDATILTGDPEDIKRLVNASARDIPVVEV